MVFFFKKDKKSFDLNKLKSNSNFLKHRGPDDDRIIDNKEYFVRSFRLSIIDTSKKASQPMFDKNKRFFLLFNGEIYNFQTLKKKLKNQVLTSNSDSEILLYTLIERGIESIN